MSDPGVIARKTKSGFEGVYCHDSYPQDLAPALIKAFLRCPSRRPAGFGRDLKRMLEVLIDDHPAGWSTIIGADWSLKSGFVDIDKKRYLTSKKPRCYCHGARREPPNMLNEKTARNMCCEWAYVFDEERFRLDVFGIGPWAAEMRLGCTLDLNSGGSANYQVLRQMDKEFVALCEYSASPHRCSFCNVGNDYSRQRQQEPVSTWFTSRGINLRRTALSFCPRCRKSLICAECALRREICRKCCDEVIQRLLPSRSLLRQVQRRKMPPRGGMK